MIDEFLSDIPRQIETLKDCVRNGDSKTAERKAHSIKGAAANMAAEALREVASGMEKAGKAGALDAVKVMMPRIEREFERVRSVMGHWVL